jgi:hypothetical protein
MVPGPPLDPDMAEAVMRVNSGNRLVLMEPSEYSAEVFATAKRL